METDVVAADLATTVVDLSVKLREAVLAGNASAAMEWAGALRDATGAWREATELAEAI